MVTMCRCTHFHHERMHMVRRKAMGSDHSEPTEAIIIKPFLVASGIKNDLAMTVPSVTCHMRALILC
jgi:hypothetical protein